MHYLLFYDVVDDYAERRLAFRAANLAHARRAVERGELVLGGALANPLDGAVLLFRGPSPVVAESLRLSYSRQLLPGYVGNGSLSKPAQLGSENHRALTP